MARMDELLNSAIEVCVLAINAMALIVIVVGTVAAFIAAMRSVFKASTGHERRLVWLRYARWLVAGLTFQLAADIIESSIATDWNSIGRLAAIAAVRTFLNYFLERDLAEVRELDAHKLAGERALP